ncbi:winged helix-turn-helix domain-containing protein [Streptomyces sp. NPDC002519]
MAVEAEHADAHGRMRSPQPQRSHHDVAEELRSRIRSGVLRPGQRMPTQAELADEFGVERGAVRQALRILQSEHLLTDVSRGSPATVARQAVEAPAGPGDPPQPTTVALAPRISAAFTAPHVKIDALCLTSVSLTLAMGGPLREIHAGRIKPARVDVRVLLPSGRIDLAFPTPVEGPDDDRLHGRWLAQRNAQGHVLRHNLLALRRTHGIDVHVSFRALPFTPPVKLYLLNGSEALFAYYTLTRHGHEIDQKHLDVYDAEGTRSLLFCFARGPDLLDTTFVEQSHAWFDALWETITTDLTLS